MSNPTTPVSPPAQSPASPAGQTTTPVPRPGPGKKQANAGQAAPTTVIPTAAPAPATQPAPTPVPRPKRKPLPRWAWSVIGGVVAAILYWVARDIMFPVIIVAMGAVIGPKVRTMISSWKQERERKAVMAAATVGQQTTPTAKAPRGPSWQAMLGSFIGMIVGIVVTVVLNWAIVMFSPGVAGQAYILPIANVVLVAMATWIGYAIGAGTGRK